MHNSRENNFTVRPISIGTSSWNFDDWRGSFYPEKTRRQEYLAYYAQQFCTVEVNTSFYGLPKAATLIQWIESVPPSFTFALKAPRTITHEKRLVDVNSETLAYLDALRSLGKSAAPGLLQLPPSLTRANSGRPLAVYLDWLAEQLRGIRMAVEVRSADLMTPAFATFLAERGFALVLVDREGTPDLYPVWQEGVKMVDEGQRPDFSFIRWIGDDRNGPTHNRELTDPREMELAQWGDRIVNDLTCTIQVFGYMHNPYEGHSPASVRRLFKTLEDRGIERATWPPAGWTAPNDDERNDGGQLSLFGES